MNQDNQDEEQTEARQERGKRLQLGNGYLVVERDYGPYAGYRPPWLWIKDELILQHAGSRLVVRDLHHLGDLDRELGLDIAAYVAHQTETAARLFCEFLELGECLIDVRKYWHVRKQSVILGFVVDNHVPVVTSSNRLKFICVSLNKEETGVDCTDIEIDLRTFDYTIAPAIPDVPGPSPDEAYFVAIWTEPLE